MSTAENQEFQRKTAVGSVSVEIGIEGEEAFHAWMQEVKTALGRLHELLDNPPVLEITATPSCVKK